MKKGSSGKALDGMMKVLDRAAGGKACPGGNRKHPKTARERARGAKNGQKRKG